MYYSKTISVGQNDLVFSYNILLIFKQCFRIFLTFASTRIIFSYNEH